MSNFNIHAVVRPDVDANQVFLKASVEKIQLGIGNVSEGVLTTLDVVDIDAEVVVKVDNTAVKATVDSLFIHNFESGLYPDILRSIGDKQLVKVTLEVKEVFFFVCVCVFFCFV